MKNPGLLITFEGTEGAGKSTLIRALETRMRASGHALTVTREPGGAAVAEQIRHLILHSSMSPWTELFLYEAARTEHLERTILPALERGNVVLCDRFTDSTLAYQGEARGLPWNTIEKLNAIAARGVRPRLTVLVDIDPALGLRSAQDPNRFEAEGVKFQETVRRGFLKSMRRDPRRWVRVVARSGTPEEMAEDLYAKILKKIPALRLAKTQSAAQSSARSSGPRKKKGKKK